MLLESEIPVTATSPDDLTVTATVAVLPLLVLAVIVAEPAALPVMVPFDTVATEVFDEDHVTVLFDALSGVTVAVTDVLLPTLMVADVFESVIPVGSTVV